MPIFCNVVLLGSQNIQTVQKAGAKLDSPNQSPKD
jgi:hypothetical protein